GAKEARAPPLSQAGPDIDDIVQPDECRSGQSYSREFLRCPGHTPCTRAGHGPPASSCLTKTLAHCGLYRERLLPMPLTSFVEREHALAEIQPLLGAAQSADAHFGPHKISSSAPK